MNNVKGVAEYIERMLAYEQYSFSWQELKASVPKTDTALKNELSRLVKKNQLISLRAGFYLILAPRFKKNKKLPIELYVDKLFSYLNKPYYVGFYSAALFHGAGHQQVQQDYIITQLPNIRDIKKGVIHLHVFAASKWPVKNVLKKKSNAGYFNISSPALTAIDLIHYQSKLGGLNRMLPNLEELAEAIKPNDLQDLLTWYPHVSTIQRLGYLLDKIQVDVQLRDLLSTYLETHRHFPVLLSTDTRKKAGKASNRWKVDVNLILENNL